MPLIKGVVSLVGLGTEAYAHHKKKKEAVREEQQQTRDEAVASQVASATTSALEEDEWLQDEAQELLGDDTSGSASVTTPVSIFPPVNNAMELQRLPCPVILPQKRPESKTKGFVRAYAPMLATCGIDQATWFNFLDGFEQSCKGQGYFHAVNLSIAAGVLSYTVATVSISPMVHITAFAVHTSIEAGRRLHNTRQINNFFERMNEELFKPRGLYVLLMTYKPTSAEPSIDFDVNQNIISSVVSRDGGKRSKFRTASGKTHGEAELPECAPLIFPSLEAANPEQKKSAFKRAHTFIGDYGDRRARAQFQHNNPDSHLNALPEEKFSSIFANPNHPIHKGGPLNTLTGGYLYKGAKTLRDSGGSLPTLLSKRAGKEGTGVGGDKGRGLKRLLAEDVLYLMVVNMPSEEEMRAAVELEAGAR